MQITRMPGMYIDNKLASSETPDEGVAGPDFRP